VRTSAIFAQPPTPVALRDKNLAVIIGAHAIIFTSEPDAAREFLRDVLGFASGTRRR
jgi:hypothetical protein